MINKKNSNKQRLMRHKRVRGKVKGTTQRPRLDVFRSSRHIYAQVIDDTSGTTLCSASTLDKGFEGSTGDVEAARKVGAAVAEKSAKLGITEVVFDRGGYIYHGRVKALAEGARDGCLKF